MANCLTCKSELPQGAETDYGISTTLVNLKTGKVNIIHFMALCSRCYGVAASKHDEVVNQQLGENNARDQTSITQANPKDQQTSQ
jgi:hypothetical protein